MIKSIKMFYKATISTESSNPFSYFVKSVYVYVCTDLYGLHIRTHIYMETTSTYLLCTHAIQSIDAVCVYIYLQ